MDMFNKITNCAETFAQCFYEPRDEENRTLIRQIDKIKKTNCVVEKMFYLKQLITRLFTMINSTEVRLFNRTNPPLTPFVYIFNSKQCEGKMRKQQFVVYNREHVVIEPFQSHIIPLQYFSSLKSDMDLEVHLPETINMEIDIISNHSGTFIRKLLLFNLINQTVQIGKNEILFSITLSKNPEERFISLKAHPDFIQSRLSILSNFSTFLGLEKYESILAKYCIANKYSLKGQVYDGVDSDQKEMIVRAVEQLDTRPDQLSLRPGCDLYFQLKSAPRPPAHPHPSHPQSVQGITLQQVKRLAAPWSNLEPMTDSTFNNLNESSRQALNSLLINKSLSRTRGILSIQDIYELQRNVPSIRKLITEAEQHKNSPRKTLPSIPKLIRTNTINLRNRPAHQFATFCTTAAQLENEQQILR